MRRPRLLLVLILGLALLGVGLGFSLARKAASASVSSPTVAMLPTNTATVSATNTEMPTMTSSPTVTNTATATDTPTPTNTLSTLVLRVTVVNPDVTLQPLVAQAATSTPTTLPTLAVPSPAAQVPNLPDGNAPLVGWFHYDVSNAAVKYSGQWNVFTSSFHSVSRHYMYTDADNARLSLRFLGAAVRLRYIKYASYGVFAVRLDDRVVTTIDSYHPKTGNGDNGEFLSTDVWALPFGWHTLEVLRLGQKNPSSSGTFVAIDGIDVYLNGLEPTAQPTRLPVTPTVTPSPVPARKIQVIIAPPTIQPTATPVSPGIASVSFTIAYDLNGNKAIDPSEGVQGISARLVTADTNQVVASGYTNMEGFVHLEATTNAPLRLVVPYLNKFWDIPARSSNMRITLLIPPANQPGLLP